MVEINQNLKVEELRDLDFLEQGIRHQLIIQPDKIIRRFSKNRNLDQKLKVLGGKVFKTLGIKEQTFTGETRSPKQPPPEFLQDLAKSQNKMIDSGTGYDLI
jgi:hypothetical protein